MYNTVPHNPTVLTEKEIDSIPIIALAFVGDAVQTLTERSRVIGETSAKTHVLHRLVAGKVNANRQAEASRIVMDRLTERESAIFKRARNVSPRNVPRHADQNSYRASSGFEAVVGYLYLTGQEERLRELFSLAYEQQGE